MQTPTTQHHWGKSLAAFTMVLFSMPLGHALMIIMKHTLPPNYLFPAAFVMGLVGLLIVVVGVFAKGDARQTILGFFGGLLFWTGWVEFLFMYYAQRYGVQPEIENGVVVTKPEYLLIPATFGLWMMIMTMYIFSTKNGCDFITWIQKRCFGAKYNKIAARPMTRHTAVVTFMELTMMLWATYLLLMFCYDKQLLGDHHPVTFFVGLFCLVGSLFMFKKQLQLSAWGANIRMAIATVIIFWTPIEILGRVNFFKEFWIEPMNYAWQMGVILIVFIVLGFYLWRKSAKSSTSSQQN